MNPDLKTEDILMQIRELLNNDQTKLWLPPYFEETSGSCEEELKKLAIAYSNALNVDGDQCLQALLQLQSHACERLQERETFQNSGIATLKIRMPGETLFTSIPTALSITVADLQEKVANRLDVVPERIKLIWSGQVLNTDKLLSSAGLRNGAQLMAVLLSDNISDLQAFESNTQTLEKTRADAQLLAGSSNTNSDPYLQIADQSGKPLDLPPAERQALIIAMSLHEKGRAAMKREDFALALVLFLKADEEFKQCQSKLLESVDNYALLNLDIAWCYLCLKNVTQIPDAEKRLKICEQNFHKSYGTNLERLMAIKGTTGNEAALFMRLHLLQAIVLFHQNKRQAAATLLQRAETELAGLKVSDTSLATLLELGYTAAEARQGLRATHGDVNAAAELITQQHQERKERDAKEREQYALGRCIDGNQWVDPALHKSLLGMGFSSTEARVALQNSNNDLNTSLQLLQDKSLLMETASQTFKLRPEWVQQLVSIGFDPRMAKVALRKHMGDIEKAVEELVALGGVIEGDAYDSDSDPESGQSSLNQRKVQRLERQAFKRLKDGLPTSETDHLDLSLEAEEAFLRQYQALL